MSLRYLFGKRHPSGWRPVYETGVRFPDDVHAILVKNFHGGYHCHIEKSVEEILAALAALDIPITSELAQLYLNYGPGCVRGHYELCEYRDLADWTDYAHETLEVDDKFVALTSIEGQGITLYERPTGHVYDVSYGEFDKLRNGEIEPVAETTSDFIRWCAKRDVEEFGEFSDSKPIA